MSQAAKMGVNCICNKDSEGIIPQKEGGKNGKSNLQKSRKI
jgi:hypothetical protein